MLEMFEMPKRAFSDSAICRRRILVWLSPLKLGKLWLKIMSIQGTPLQTGMMKMLRQQNSQQSPMFHSGVQWHLELPIWNMSVYSMGGLKTWCVCMWSLWPNCLLINKISGKSWLCTMFCWRPERIVTIAVPNISYELSKNYLLNLLGLAIWNLLSA